MTSVVMLTSMSHQAMLDLSYHLPTEVSILHTFIHSLISYYASVWPFSERGAGSSMNTVKKKKKPTQNEQTN